MRAGRVQRGSRAVEAAVAQHEPLDVLRLRHDLLHVTDRRHPLARPRKRIGVERILLRLDHLALLLVRPARVALRDEPPRARRPGGLQQIVRALGPKAVGQRELGVKVLEVLDPGERGQRQTQDIAAKG